MCAGSCGASHKVTLSPPNPSPVSFARGARGMNSGFAGARLEGLAPFGSERARPLGVALVEEVGGDDTVHAEMAEIAAQLAPGRHHSHGFEITDGDRPDGAFGDALLLVAVAQEELAAGMDLGAQLGGVDTVLRDGAPGPGAAGGVED